MYSVKADLDAFVDTCLVVHQAMLACPGTVAKLCVTGRTRSGSLVVAYLILEYRLSLVQAKRIANAGIFIYFSKSLFRCNGDLLVDLPGISHRSSGSDYVDYMVDRNNEYGYALHALALGCYDYRAFKSMRLGEDRYFDALMVQT